MANHRFDPHFTQDVIDAIGPKTSPRTRQVMSSLIRHVHDFAREVELTTDEWMLGLEFLTAVGGAQRAEGQLVSDVIGLESLVDEMAQKRMDESHGEPTPSSILGPFWSPNAPVRPLGGSIIQDPHDGQVTRMHGKVNDLATGKGVPGATVDIWQAFSNGKYDIEDRENQTDNNMRGKFETDQDGRYHLYCLRPTSYSIPADGPARALLSLLDRHPYRPAHIHLRITHPSFKPVTTQIFPADDPYLSTDSVFAVKNNLIVDFKPGKDDKASLDVEFNIILAPNDIEGALNGALSPSVGANERSGVSDAATMTGGY